MFKTAKYLALAYSLALAAAVLFLGSWDEPAGLLLLPFVYVWIVCPELFAAASVRLSQGPGGAAWFLAVQAVITIWTAWSWYDLMFVRPHSMNGIALAISIPFWQYVFFAAAWLVGLAAGWRRRSDWP